jgi:hypothetical protein
MFFGGVRVGYGFFVGFVLVMFFGGVRGGFVFGGGSCWFTNPTKKHDQHEPHKKT